MTRYKKPTTSAGLSTPWGLVCLRFVTRTFLEPPDKSYYLLLERRLKLGRLDTLDEQIWVQWTRGVICLDELPTLLGYRSTICSPSPSWNGRPLRLLLDGNPEQGPSETEFVAVGVK
jgi:hypothetical protein